MITKPSSGPQVSIILYYFRLPGLKEVSKGRLFYIPRVKNEAQRRSFRMKKPGIYLDKYLSLKAILLNLQASTKPALLQEMIDKLVNNKVIVNNKLIFQELWRREELGSTALAEGIALPHALLPDLSRPIIALGVHSRGIDFGHPEGHLTYVFLLILGNKDDPGLQLRLLAHACRLIKETDFVNQLKQVSTPQEALRVVEEAERKLA
ncbi:MAG: hypothetical protein DRI99_00360 [Candidatus Aminicenantes bacterium]|nr:MAG: hypothetical protein DRI99_00360 [Candidatus Aminicenantes bacterium]HHF42184.1 PTS sugar transporter subunit IIA [Candidatus Aminicenantes bacterium]